LGVVVRECERRRAQSRSSSGRARTIVWWRVKYVIFLRSDFIFLRSIFLRSDFATWTSEPQQWPLLRIVKASGKPGAPPPPSRCARWQNVHRRDCRRSALLRLPVVPPSRVARIVPWSPTAQPVCASAKCTATRSLSVPLFCGSQLVPPSLPPLKPTFYPRNAMTHSALLGKNKHKANGELVFLCTALQCLAMLVERRRSPQQCLPKAEVAPAPSIHDVSAARSVCAFRDLGNFRGRRRALERRRRGALSVVMTATMVLHIATR
jgi:hypothetical protein